MIKIDTSFKVAGILAIFLLIISCDNKTQDMPLNVQPVDTNKVESRIKVYPLVSVESPVGNKAADFVWAQDGRNIRFSEFTKGKYVLLNFWGTWCGPCREEIPDLIAISKEMKDKRLIVIGASFEHTTSVQKAVDIVSEYWEENGMDYINVIATRELSDAYGNIIAVPMTFLIDSKGDIFKILPASRTKEEFMTEINKMIE